MLSAGKKSTTKLSLQLSWAHTGGVVVDCALHVDCMWMAGRFIGVHSQNGSSDRQACQRCCLLVKLNSTLVAGPWTAHFRKCTQCCDPKQMLCAACLGRGHDWWQLAFWASHVCMG